MKFLLIVALVLFGGFLFLKTGAKKSDAIVNARFNSSSSVEIDNQILTLDEAIKYVNGIVEDGKIVDLLISGNVSDREQLAKVAEVIKSSPSFKGRNVLVIVSG